ncbi:hypothetical protein FDZ73_19800 [bacterium]|nr:MAG: hypothetical protein FDZ73_19800 [bacterium]
MSEVLKTLLAIESRGAFRHCLITRYDGDLSRLASLKAGKTFHGRNATYTVDFTDGFERGVVLTLSHKVEVVDWVKSENGDTQFKCRREIRHPITVRLYDRNSVALLSYPGFSLGGGANRSTRVAYQGIAQDVIDFLSHEGNFTFSTFPVERCLHLLSMGSSNQLKIVKTDIEPPNGRLNIASAYKVASVEDIFLRSFLKPILDKLEFSVEEGRLHSAIAEVLQQAQTNSMTVSWVKEGVVTRVDFWDIGTELLFVWNAVDSSYFCVDNIVDLLISVSNQLDKANLADVWKWIIELDNSSVLTLGSVVSKFGLSSGEAKEVVFKAVSVGIIEPVYRLATTEILLDWVNDWHGKLTDLKRVFVTEGGLEIDGADPRFIDVAFRKVASQGGMQ